MEQRRFVLFLSLSILIWFGWVSFVMPRFFPKPARHARPEAAAQQAGDEAPVSALTAKKSRQIAPVEKEAEAPPAAPAADAQHPDRIVNLGSMQPDSGYFMHVQLNSLGAAIDFIELNDPRYPEFKKRRQALKVIGSDSNTKLRTFATDIPALDKQLATSNRDTHWEVVSESESAAEFRLVAPDGGFEVTKKYELKQAAATNQAARDSQPEGYELVLTVTFRNLKAKAAAVDYVLQGPVGLPLEDAENSSKYRDIRMGFLQHGKLDNRQVTATDVADKQLANKIEEWKQPIKYIGVDVKYFAGLIVPLQDQLQTQTVAASRAQLVDLAPEKKFSDISVLLDSQAELSPKGDEADQVSHEYLLFAGPKRQALLSGVAAESIVDFGYVDIIARLMLGMLNAFRSLGVGYGIAIILLTVCVRLAMFPVSRHQAHNMQRMKDLQPKIKELQKKYENNREELGRAQMELFRKHNYNPLSGCLPLFLQLPIFIGLYTALSSSVDLRMARFLWIDNLASPDALFPLGFKVPWFGWTDFNLLPIISTGLMFFQQKMMMPPPADEEQAMQQKMMNYMMIFMGAMFYRVPAGLCIYFIASSVWGMVERWALNKLSASSPPAPPIAEGPGKTEPPDDKSSGPGGRLGDLWKQLQSVADKDVSITRSESGGSGHRNGKKKKG